MRFNKSTKLYCCIGRILQWNQRNFRALKHSTWYHNNAYMSLYICLNPCMSALRMSHDENHGLGWLWCVSAGSLVLTSHSAWACWWWRKLCIRGLAGGMWETSESPLQFFCKLKTAHKNEVIIKKWFALGMKNPITTSRIGAMALICAKSCHVYHPCFVDYPWKCQHSKNKKWKS